MDTVATGPPPTHQSFPPTPPQNSPPPQDLQPRPKERNTLGIIALIASIAGFIFAVIPGALIIGWILLPIAFILALVSLFQKNKGKGTGVAALIISILGVITGVIVFFAVVVDAIDNAFTSESTVTIVDDAGVAEEAVEDGAAVDVEVVPEAEDAADDAGPTVDEGTRANPYPVGTTVSADDWSVTVNDVVLDATDVILAENPFNDPPEEGTQYLMVNITATYDGDDPDGDMPWVSVDYVTSGGNTVTSADTFAVTPDSFDSFETMYSGASTTGNIALQVPSETAGEGVLAVTPSMFGEKVFIAVQ